MTDTSPTGWTLDAAMQVKRIGSVRASPDGRRVAFTVRAAIIAPEQSTYRTHIYLANADGSDPVQLTRGEASCEDPQWSPDGQWIAFTSSRSGRSSLWCIPVRGGEAEQLTDIPTEVSSFQWSPDGQWIAFTADDPPSAEEQRAAREKVDVRIVDRDLKMHHLYLIPVEAGPDGRRPARQLTRGAYNVGAAIYHGLYSWSPDGRVIAFTHTQNSQVNDWDTCRISLVDVDGGQVTPLISEVSAIQPCFSPDGRWIACRVYDEPAWLASSCIHLVPASGGTSRPLAETSDKRPDLIGWSADVERLYYTEQRGTTVRLYALPANGEPPAEIGWGEGVISEANLNRRQSHIAFVFETADQPPEAYVSSLAAFAPAQVSRVHQDLPDLRLGRTEIIRWPSVDGLEIEGLLTYPVGYEKGQRYPLLLSIHGGPANVFSQAFIGSPTVHGPTAAFAACGYAVLRCNVRGSTGYGKAFRQANYRDWGGRDVQDALAGVDQAISMGIADPERLVVMGWSYGGFMTAAVITQTRRFRAAVVGAGITDLISNAGTADIPSDIPTYFGGEPAEVLDLLRARSPALNVEGVSTPTLILHGELDERVPITQGYELYNALKRHGRTVEMVVYPRTPHLPNEPKLYRDIMRRQLAWADRYIESDERAAEAPQPSTSTVGPQSEVSLREVTRENWLVVCRLSNTLAPPQSSMVAPNVYSIAEAHFSEHAWFRAIYADETPVGFLMLHDSLEDEPGYFIWRLMIGQPYQGMGFARRAIELLVDYVKTRPGARVLGVSCHPGEEEGSPEGFYRRLGFERDGRMYGDEVGLSLALEVP